MSSNYGYNGAPTNQNYKPPSYTPQPQYAPNQQDLERGQAAGWGDLGTFSDKSVRIRFIRKVYLILSAQLTFTFAIVSIFVFAQPVKEFATKTTAGLVLYIAAYVIFLGLIITFSFCQCFGEGLRKVPYNYMLLIGITVSLTYLLGMISAFHSLQAVLMAIGTTLIITFGVTLFAMQTRYDFTRGCMFVAVCLSFALFGFGIIAGISSIYAKSYVLQAVYGGLGAALMALFLAIDTQLLMGNKKYSYSEEDYINAALQLYLDICYIFMYLLQLFGAGNK